MATVRIDSEKPRVDDDEGPFVDPLQRLVLIFMLALAVVTIIALGIIYWGDSFAVPSWNERSVPPPVAD